MPKDKRERGAKGEEAVLNLTISGSLDDAQVREVVDNDESFKTPCTITGLMAGLSGGSLGYVFGFGGYWLRTRTHGAWRASLADGWSSAKTFAIMGGLYAAVSCFMLRIRQKQDAWNGAVSGCATGLALGWAGGARSALQSCAMLGAFSYFLDGMAGGEAANASTVGGASGGRSSGNGGGGRRVRSPIELLLSPAVPLLAAMQPCRSWGDGEGGGGCRVVQQQQRW